MGYKDYKKQRISSKLNYIKNKEEILKKAKIKRDTLRNEISLFLLSINVGNCEICNKKLEKIRLAYIGQEDYHLTGTVLFYIPLSKLKEQIHNYKVTCTTCFKKINKPSKKLTQICKKCSIKSKTNLCLNCKNDKQLVLRKIPGNTKYNFLIDLRSSVKCLCGISNASQLRVYKDTKLINKQYVDKISIEQFNNEKDTYIIKCLNCNTKETQK